MSMRTIYIRKEHEDVFDSIPKKAEFFAKVLEQLKQRRLQEPKYTPPENTA